MLYFDAVLDKNYVPLFNGTPEATLKWFEENGISDETMVGLGKELQIITVAEYKARKKNTSCNETP